MRRSTLTFLLIGAAFVGVGAWLAANRDHTEKWLATVSTDSKAILESIQSPLSEQVAAEPTKSTADGYQEGESHAGEAEHARTEGTVAPEADHNEEGAASEGHAEHHEAVELTPGQIADFGIKLEVAGKGEIANHLERPAEVKFNGDRVVHVVSRVEGIVTDVAVSQGELVDKNAVLATLESRELTELKATYLAAFERRNLSRETFERERRLWEKKISAERDYLNAKTNLAEANIAVRASEQKLKALGFSDEFLSKLANTADANLTKYNVVAPISGTIVERHISLGEAVSTDKEAFVLADTSTVWIEVTIYPQDLPLVRAGQNVVIEAGDEQSISGKIAFVTPHVREETRTAIARVITGSAEGRLKPGMFVKAQVEIGQQMAGVRVPKSAIQNYEEGPVVFVQEEEEKFEPRPVKVGRENTHYVEILAGVSAGETYVAEGAFTLKAQLSKASFGDGHNH